MEKTVGKKLKKNSTYWHLLAGSFLQNSVLLLFCMSMTCMFSFHNVCVVFEGNILLSDIQQMGLIVGSGLSPVPFWSVYVCVRMRTCVCVCTRSCVCVRVYMCMCARAPDSWHIRWLLVL